MLLRRDTANRLKRLSARYESGTMGGKVRRNYKGGGSTVMYFVLAEDAVEMPVYAYPGELDELTGDITPVADSEPFELYYWLSVLSSPEMAKAGYAGIHGVDNVGRNIFVNGPCIDGCTTEAGINPGSPPDGEDGTAYTHTVVVSGLDVDGVTADNLPPGLSLNPTTGAITGTPTTPGTYWVTFMGDSNDYPSCPITRIAKIVIWGEGLMPDPEPPVEDP